MAVSPATVSLARRPVVCDGRIVEADVVVTPDQPLGVWRVDGVEVAPVLDALRSHEGGGQEAEAAPALLMSRFGFGQSRARALLDWMRAQAWLN